MSTSRVPAPRPVAADVLPGSRVRDVALVGVFAVAIALSAQVAFPLPGTPILVTGQTFVVLLGAAALGAARATAGSMLFLAAGVVGVPWFAHAGGTSVGYIVGFVAAAMLVGWLARVGWVSGHLRATATMVAGNLVIYAFGVPVVAVVLGVGAREAIALGLVPFLIGDAVKVALAALLLPFAQRAVERSDQR